MSWLVACVDHVAGNARGGESELDVRTYEQRLDVRSLNMCTHSSQIYIRLHYSADTKLPVIRVRNIISQSKSTNQKIGSKQSNANIRFYFSSSIRILLQKKECTFDSIWLVTFSLSEEVRKRTEVFLNVASWAHASKKCFHWCLYWWTIKIYLIGFELSFWSNNKHVVCSVFWEDQNLGHVYYVWKHRLLRDLSGKGKNSCITNMYVYVFLTFSTTLFYKGIRLGVLWINFK